VVRRELKRLSPDVQVGVDDIKAALTSEVLKREVLEGDSATDAKKKLDKLAAKALREKESTKPKLSPLQEVDQIQPVDESTPE
jgi:hypothetical protein